MESLRLSTDYAVTLVAPIQKENVMRYTIVFTALALVATSAMGQQQPQVYALSEDGQQATPVNPQPRTIHHYPVYNQPQQQVDDQQDTPPSPRKMAMRRQNSAVSHKPYQLTLVPNDVGPEDVSAYVMGVFTDRDQCQQSLAGVYNALGTSDPDFYLVCQPHSE